MKSRSFFHRLASLAACVAGAACTILTAGRAEAQNDRIIDTPTGWLYYYSLTGAEVDAQVAAGFRPISVDRNAANSYDVVFVQNTGAYQAGGGMLRRGNTATQLNSYVTTNNLRVLDLEAYDSGGGVVLYDAVLIANSGATAAPGWGYNIFTDWNGVVNYATTNNLRPIDIDSFNTANGRRFTIVGVPNTGNNAQSFGWLFGQTAAQVTAAISAGNGARLIDIDIESVGTVGNPTVLFNIVYVGDNPGLGVWNYNMTSGDVDQLAGNNGARLTHLERYTTASGATRFAGMVVDNLNTEGRRIRGLMSSQMPSSTRGFARRRVGGGIELGLNEGHQFEPASTMKIVHGAYAISRCAAGASSLSTSIYCEDNCLGNAGDCPDTSGNCNAGNQSLDYLMTHMFQDSNNNMTGAIENYYGRSTINNWLAGRGLSIRINHTLGCLCGQTNNQMSPADVTSLYEMINDGTLFSQSWENELFANMINSDAYNFTTLNAMIDTEAAATNLTSTEISQFKAQVKMAYKAGSYLCFGSPDDYDKSNAGWASMPFRSILAGNIITTTRTYTVAMFVNNSSSDSQSNNVYNLFYELLREPIRSALQSWDSVCTTPVITNDPDSVTATAGTNVSFSSTVSGSSVGRTYVWYRNTGGGYSAISNVSGHISGATTTTLSITNVQSADQGQYYMRVNSGCGSDVSTSATLTVNAACTPATTTNPSNQTVTATEDAVFSIVAGGTSTGRTYQWQKRNAFSVYVSIVGAAGYSGASTATLTVLAADSADEGSYRCVVTNGCGTATSSPATLTVNPLCVAPSITANPVPLTVNAGESAVFTIGSTGSTSGRTYQWQKRPGIIGLYTNLSDRPGQVQGATTFRLTLLDVNVNDGGYYRCVVTNSCGSDTSTAASLTVVPVCGSADFNNDGDVGTDADIEAFFACLGGNCCATCGTADFNADGDVGTDADIEAFFRVLSGGAC